MVKNLCKIFLAVSAVALGLNYSGAYLTDTEISSGNTFSAVVWADPVINEIYSNPISGEIEWIELLNFQTSTLALTGYTIEDGTGSQRTLETYFIPGNGYLVLRKGADFSFGLNNPGDIIILRKNGEIKDQVTYGNWNDGNIADNATAPAAGESLGRIPNGTDTNTDSSDFQIRTHTEITPGDANV